MKNSFAKIVLVAYLVGSPALAGTIGISITHSLTIEADRVTANLEIGNTGDEAAHSVGSVVEFQGTEVRGETRPALEPGTSYQETLAISNGELTTGRWPYRIAVDYADANQYPFQAIHTGTFQVGNPPPAAVALSSITAPVMTGDGVAIAVVKNLTGDPRAATLRLALPRGLESPNGIRGFELAPWEEKSLELPIVNRFALAGSRYPLYAVLEYDDGSVHQSQVASGDLEIVAVAGGAPKESVPYLWIIGAVLGLLFVGLAIWRLARG